MQPHSLLLDLHSTQYSTLQNTREAKSRMITLHYTCRVDVAVLWHRRNPEREEERKRERGVPLPCGHSW